MKVGELINELNKIEDKTLDVRVLENNPNNPDLNMENYWLDEIEISSFSFYSPYYAYYLSYFPYFLF